MKTMSASDLILNKDGSVLHLGARPEQLGDFIIVVSDLGMAHKVSQRFDEVLHEVNKKEFNVHTGRFKGKNVSVISCGVGADNIEILYNELDALVNFDLKKGEVKEKKKKLSIVRIGESEAIQDDINPGSIIAAEYGVGFDHIFNFYELPQNEFEKSLSVSIRQGLNFEFLPYCVKGSSALRKKFQIEGVIFGNTVSSPGFYAPQSRSLRLPVRYPDLHASLKLVHQGDFWFTDLDRDTAVHYAMARLLGHDVISLNAVTVDRQTNKMLRNAQKIMDRLIEEVLQCV